MIPLKLTLKGIYSYQTEQSIDFESLTKNHLFGIFGPVGSGKSTILEAISYALYGETERLNVRDGRNYNMMNLKSNELLIDFTFKSGAKNSELYRFTVKGKRDKKDFNIVRTLDRDAYKQENKAWIPIDSNTAEEIIGLSYDNFRRTIIIPQGKFQEFLQLGDADRTQMMKEIFNLERYDLSAKTDVVDKMNTTELQNVIGQLSQIGQVEQSMIDDESQKRQALMTLRRQLEKELEKVEISEKALQDLKALLDKLQQHEAEVEKLESRKAYYQQREQLIEEYEVCIKNFPDLLKQRQELERAISTRQGQINTAMLDANNLVKELQRLENEFDSVKHDFENRHDLEVQWKELESIQSILALGDELSKLEQREVKLEKDIATKKGKLEFLNRITKESEAKLKSGKKDLPDQKTLVEIKRWHDRRNSLKERIEELEESLQLSVDEISALDKDKQAILMSEIVKGQTIASERRLPLSEIVTLLKSKIKECRTLSASKQDEIDSLKKRETLELFAAELKEGEPCPLCGSSHHPHIYAEEGAKATIVQLSKEKRKSDKEVEALQECMQRLMEIHTKISGLEKTQIKDTKERDAKSKDLTDHSETFKWKEYEGKTVVWINSELERAEGIKDTIEQLEETLEDCRASIQTLSDEISSRKEDLQVIATQSSNLNGRRKTLEGQIKHFSKNKIDELTPASAKKKAAALKLSYETIEERYKRLDVSIRAKKDSHSKVVATIEADQKLLEQQMNELKTVDQEIGTRLKASDIRDVKTVEEILARKLNVKNEREDIRKYRERLASAQDLRKKLEQDLGETKYDPKAHAEFKSKIDTFKKDLRKTNEEIGLQASRVLQLSENLRKKTQLEAIRDKLDGRRIMLATLKKLFRGGRFVNYASRVYLRNLCGIANQRFTQLTRQKLRLELRDDNSFEIRDFLNDGKLRNVKTLSGGQTFQASLSLALSLVDNLQQFAKSEENFFFLDEGFGTLDKESLRIVFDALKSLRKDNRIVGVISHVEEMQQEIDNYIDVRLDPEQGSIVQAN